MKTFRWLGLVLLGTPFLLAGCLYSTNDKPLPVGSGQEASPAQAAQEGDSEAEIQNNLANLGPEDQKLALAQKYCVISEGRLGSMGAPIKITVKDQPVFLCCGGCKKRALADPDKTLARVEELKSRARAESTK
jgi:hypothetical protein